MTWAEFCIRLFAYQRLDKKEWYKVRLIAYQMYVSNWHDAKRKPKDIEKYLPLENKEKPNRTKAQETAINKAKELYKIQKNGAA